VFEPEAIFGQPSACAGVGASNDASNQSRTPRENGVRADPPVDFRSTANPPSLRIGNDGSEAGATSRGSTACYQRYP
jgi:hypothetical protein